MYVKIILLVVNNWLLNVRFVVMGVIGGIFIVYDFILFLRKLVGDVY